MMICQCSEALNILEILTLRLELHLISRHAHLFMSRAPPNILGILQPIVLKFGVSLPVPKPSSHTKFEPNRLGSFGEMD